MSDERKPSVVPGGPGISRDEARAFVEKWKQAGPVLQRVRAQELGEITDETRLDIVERVLFADLPVSERRMKSSGLIEQQRRFARIREMRREQSSS